MELSNYTVTVEIMVILSAAAFFPGWLMSVYLTLVDYFFCQWGTQSLLRQAMPDHQDVARILRFHLKPCWTNKKRFDMDTRVAQ